VRQKGRFLKIYLQIMKKNHKGFTLIEMAVVLLVIGILAGIVLRNIGGQSAMARDTRRLGDLRNTANYLSTYLGKFGYFPSSTSWTDLEAELQRVGVVDRLPIDPSRKDYFYFPCSDTGSNPPPESEINHFILQANLEQTPSSSPRLWETAVTTMPNNWLCYINGSWVNSFSDNTCNPSFRNYCLAQ